MLKVAEVIITSLLVILHGRFSEDYLMKEKYESCLKLKRNVPSLNLHCEDLIDVSLLKEKEEKKEVNVITLESKNKQKVKKDDEEKLIQMIYHLKHGQVE